MIYVTSIVQPKQGAVVLCYCPQCRKATLLVSEHAIKPKDGDLWKFEACIDVPAHNIPEIEIELKSFMEEEPWQKVRRYIL